MSPFRISVPLLAPVLVSLAATPALLASEAEEVPSFEEVTGFEIGERIMSHNDMVRYLEALDRHSDRVSLFEMGESFERRTLTGAIVTSEANHERLDEIRETARRLDDPRLGEVDIEDQPTIVWFAGAIHGNELSGAEGLIRLVEELARAEDDEALERILDNTVIIADPILNPDGREAFVAYNHRRVGHEIDGDTDDWANDYTGWEGLGFRTSHYFFDINRDWFANTHPETRGRQEVIREWRPQVAVDAHEMGPDVEFHIDPPVGPINPFFPDFTTEWFEHFGDAHAAAFDESRIEYTVRDIFNFFYPGYTTSWSSYQGAVGMLYEQGNTSGLAYKRPDGSIRTLADGARNQYTAFRAAIELASDQREALLADYRAAHEQAIDDGERGVRRYVLTPDSRDPGLLAEAVALLKRNGIEVERLTEDANLRGSRDRYGRTRGTVSVPQGSYLIEAAQPRQNLIRALLEPETPVPEEFLEKARERVDRGENPRFYDITAWSLPLLFDLEAWGSISSARLETEAVEEDPVPEGAGEVPRAEYGWLIDGSQTGAMAALHRLTREGYRAAVANRDFEINGDTHARGTVILLAGNNPDSLEESLAAVAEDYELQLRGVDEGRTSGGELPALGAADTFDVKEANIALLAEQPVHPHSFGWAWHSLDAAWEIPSTVLRVESVSGTRLERFDTLVIPDTFSAAALAERLGESGIERLKQWVRDGGNLVVIGNGVEFAVDQLELIGLEDGWATDEDESPVQEFSVPGAFFATEMDERHWLSTGFDTAPPVLVDSSHNFRAPERPPSPAHNAVIRYADNDGPLAGHAWEESVEVLPGAVFAWEESVGSGRVVALPEDVNFRGYWRAMDRLFLNAVVLGPSA